LQSRDHLDQLLEVIAAQAGKTSKQVLVLDADADRRTRLLEQINWEGVQVAAVGDPTLVAEVIHSQSIDCVVLDASGAEFARELVSATVTGNGIVQTRLPVIIHGDTDDDAEALSVWNRLGQVCTVRTARSTDRMIDLVIGQLHHRIGTLPDGQRQALLELHQSNKPLAGRKVLIVDDDMRNIFALSTVLEEHDMKIISADNGRDAITMLEQMRDIDAVLMDIMMPEMDGMETMRAIRKIPGLDDVPIVAVTAKAMKGDREKCIEAGAWDYLSKPVDAEQMLSVLRAWLHR
jgi:CheY-like chemotaxis protein